MVEVAEEEHGAEGGKYLEAPVQLKPKGTEETRFVGKPMETKTLKTTPKTMAKKGAVGHKRSHPGNFIYLYSVC